MEATTMHDAMTKAQVLDTLRAEQIRWEALLTEVGDARMTEQILASWWSIKDMIAHITWYEQQTAELLQPATRHRPARDWLWDLTADKRNALLFTESRDRSLPELRAEAEQVFAQLVAAVEALTAEEMRDPRRFPTMPPGWQPWHFIAHNSYEHYQQHMPSIRAWLDTLGPEVDPTRGREGVAGVEQAAPPGAAQQPGLEQEASITNWEAEGGRG